MGDRLAAVLGERYVVLREVGRGGAATVFLADDVKHRRRVAVKVLSDALARASRPERFRREIAIAAQLNHPHIVPLLDSGAREDLLFYVMPYVDGETLRERLDRDGPLPLTEATAIARDVAEALDYAHALGVVHRDIKPANILLSSGHALVVDFGVARALEAARVQDVTATTETAIGTPAYMSPEQALGDRRLDGRADVYSLGCLLFEMLTGQRPYPARTVLGQVAQHVQARVPSVAETRAGVGRETSAVIEKALAKDPEGRFATAGELVAALVGTRDATRSLRPWDLPVALGRWQAALLGVTAVAAVVAGIVATVDSSVPLEGRPVSVAVLAFETGTSTEEEQLAAAELAADVSTELGRWDSIYVVPTISLSGPMFDMGLTGPTLADVQSGLRLARSFDVQAMLGVTLDRRGDSARVEASLFDVRRGRAVEGSLVATDRWGSPGLIGRVAYYVLRIDEAGGEVRSGSGSSSPEAVRAFAEGSRHLARWQLGTAEERFRRALELDPTFALAHHRLATTLYWGATGDARALQAAGPEIARLSAEALRGSASLATQDSLHVRAFFWFQEGAYEEARETYRRILERYPSDLYAWVMLGSTEYHDRWLHEAHGRLVPRQNLNRALAAFEEALRLQPTFELAYGHVFAIHRVLAQASETAGCPGFAEPRDDHVAPWESEPPDRLRAFCAVARDSIEWVALDRMRSLRQGEGEDALARLFDRSLRTVRRWVAYAPDQPRPREELAAMLEWSRLMAGPDGPEELRSLAAEALAAAEGALALRRDTVAEDLYRIANLRLAAGDARGGAELAERTRERFPAAAPAMAANVFLATGRTGAALEIVSRPRLQWSIEAPTGELVPYDGGEVILERIRVLASVAGGGGRLVSELSGLDRHLSLSRYSPEARRTLLDDATLRVMPALAADPGALAAWRGKARIDHPLWHALTDTALDRAEARAYVAGSTGPALPALGDAGQAYVAGEVAMRAGDYRLAIEAFARLDSLALSTEFFHPGWGLRALAMQRRGEAYERMGDTAAALAEYRAFAEAWADPDPLAAPLVDEARARIRRLSGNR